MSGKGQKKETDMVKHSGNGAHFDAFVLDKGIFSNVFDKDIRRVYIYKKAERLAKAIHLVAPAFKNSSALREKMDLIAIGLVDAAVLPPASARTALSRELLALSSVLSIARASALLSPMNADVIARESHSLLQEVAAYEEPRLAFEDSPTLAMLAKSSTARAPLGGREAPRPMPARGEERKGHGDKGQNVLDNSGKASRREAILEVLKGKGPSYIKDISTRIRDVSEKTIQRELQVLVAEGRVSKEGERRWTTYAVRAETPNAQ
ncbi:MAG TPA: hypothetical protein VFY28_00250 [Candidatus Paceibacterota bacterium]|nr:hypothetical protein [Candidatus Paceibacterota bacterium]